MPPATPTPAELALEQAGLEFLRGGKFRKARDAFKSLNKSQPSRALPLLIEANLGLANEMMAKGLVSEANQVLAYLKTIAPASYDLNLTAVTKAAPRDAWSAMVPLAAQRLAATTQPDAGIRAADEIILGAESPEHPGHPDAKAILSALELGYGSAFTEQTTPLLRAVPRSSPFSHWVFFFKGMTALESGDHSRAVDYFRRVPKNSLLQASLPALMTLCGDAAPQPAPRTVHALCAWAGHPALAEPLLQADPLWRKKHRSKAFTLLTNKIPGLMCWGARGVKEDLTRFLTREYGQCYLEDEAYCDKVLDYISVKSRTVARAVIDQTFFTIGFTGFSSCAHRHFQIALENLDTISRVAPVSPAMLSRIFTRLAEEYIASVKRDPGDRCSPPNARKALEQAIKHDPANLHAWLTQCDLLAMGKDSSAYHRFVDDLTKRFPAEKEVLIRNGDCCIGRGSHTKALRNFENAAKIDSVDPRIARGILRSRLGIAEEACKKGNPSKANWPLIDSLASANKSCPEFSLWRLRVRQLVLEARYIGEEKLAALAATALPLSPNAFRFEVACRIGISKYQMAFKPGVLEKILPSRPEPQSLADFLAVIDEVEATDDGAPYVSASDAAHKIFAEHQDRLVELIIDRKDLTTLLIKVFSSRIPSPSLASPVIQKWLARHPSDPVLLYLCMSYKFPWLPKPPKGDSREIATRFRNSKDPDDQRLLMLFDKDRQRGAAARYRGAREKTPKLDLDYDPHGEDDDDDYDEDDDYDDDFYMEEAFDAIDQVAGKMSPSELIATLGKIIDSSGFGSPGGPSPSKPATPKAPKTAPGNRSAPDPGQLTFEPQIIPPPQP